jgi:DNA-binding NtrC family response regulator
MGRRVLIIDGDRAVCGLLDAELQRRGFDTTVAASADDALRRIGLDDFDLVLADLHLAPTSGVELCRAIVQRREHLPVVVMTPVGSRAGPIAAIRTGAYDFVTKPFEMDDLALTLARALKNRALREEVQRLRGFVTTGKTREPTGANMPAPREDLRAFDIPAAPSALLPMNEVERRYIVRVLAAVGGNKTLAAQLLGFDRRTLYRKLERFRDAPQRGVRDAAHPRSTRPVHP